MKNIKIKEIFGIKSPEKDCSDSKCPFHGEITVKKELITGKIVKKDISRSATIEWNRSIYVPKYERYEFRKSRVRVHNPACIDAQIGEKVIAARTRPLSKNKNHIILSVVEAGKVALNNEMKRKVSKEVTSKEVTGDNYVSDKG